MAIKRNVGPGFVDIKTALSAHKASNHKEKKDSFCTVTDGIVFITHQIKSKALLV